MIVFSFVFVRLGRGQGDTARKREMRKREREFRVFFFVPCSFVALFNSFSFSKSRKQGSRNAAGRGGRDKKKAKKQAKTGTRAVAEPRVRACRAPIPRGDRFFCPARGVRKKFFVFFVFKKKNDPLPSSLSFFQLQELEIERALSFFFFLGQPGKK